MKNFIDLSSYEKEMVLSWRNNIRIRNNMYSSNEITLENHLIFIDKLVGNKEKKYFLVEDLGVIYFNNIKNNRVEIGLYSNPRKYGVGSILMEKILSFDFDHFYLEVRESNKKAIELYHKYKFEEKMRKNIDGNEIICMELKNENRQF